MPKSAAHLKSHGEFYDHHLHLRKHPNIIFKLAMKKLSTLAYFGGLSELISVVYFYRSRTPLVSDMFSTSRPVLQLYKSQKKHNS